MRRYLFVLIVILLISSFFRLFGLSSRDTLGDEANYGFRSIGYLDYDNEPVQHSTPIEWYDSDAPKWLAYSFHDAPPLFFLIQHASFRVFGDNRFALRFPSAIFGVLSIPLIILIGANLYSLPVGFIAGALSAVSISAIYISRIGIIESTLVFFLLLTNLIFLYALKNRWLFIAMGVSFGLSLLTKYTAVVFFPISIVCVYVLKKEVFHDWRLWCGYVIALVMQTPVILYNLHLYVSFGHVDYALMNLFGEPPDVWQSNPGREIGSIWDRIANFVPQLFFTHFWVIVILFGFSLGYILWRISQKPKERGKRHAFLLVSYLFLVILIIMLGPAPRFLSMAGPYMRLAIAYCIYIIWQHTVPNRRKWIALGVSLVGILSLFYAINSFILPHPIGPWRLAYGAVVRNSFKWGYAELGDYLRKELYHKRPTFTVKPHYEFLKTVLNDRKDTTIERGYEPYPAIIIYDQNIARMPEHWIFDRLNIYKGWPVFTVEDYQKMIAQNGIKRIQDMNLVYYFIIPFEAVHQKQEPRLTANGEYFEGLLQERKIEPKYIKTFDEFLSFRVYRWQGETIALP